MKKLKELILSAAAVTLLLNAIVLGAPKSSTSPIRATLVVPDRDLLPGVPFDLWIDMENPTDSRVTVGLDPVLHVRTEDGDEFDVDPERSPVLMDDGEGNVIQELTLSPREKRTIALPIEVYMNGSALTGDRRLTAPGTYRLSISLNPFSERESERETTDRGSVVTNEVEIRRVLSTPEDERIWARLIAESNGSWDGTWWGKPAASVIAHDIINSGKTSGYYPYALLGRGIAGPSSIESYVDALRRFPNSPVAEALQLRLWHSAARFQNMPGHALAKVHANAESALKASRRPTTRRAAFGREDMPKRPCPPEHDCVN